MTIAELRRLAEQLPAGTSLTLDRATLLQVLAPVVIDLTVRQVAEQLHRSPSTVRGWLEAGRFADAYKLNRRDWRIPPAAVEALLSGQRPVSSPQDAPGRAIATHKGARPRRAKAGKANLGAWRAERRAVSSPGQPI